MVFLRFQIVAQQAPLNVITSGLSKSDYFKRMITFTKWMWTFCIVTTEVTERENIWTYQKL
jgi:hypothetical protein